MSETIQLDRNQFERLRLIAQQEGVKDLTQVSDKAAAIFGEANWQIIQAAKAQNRYVTLTVARMPGESGRVSG